MHKILPYWPHFLTFTGIDAATRPQDLIELSNDYPDRVEFAILIRDDNESDNPRYPNKEELIKIVNALKNKVQLAIHLCGAYTRQIEAGMYAGLYEDTIPLTVFDRVQVNGADSKHVKKLADAIQRHCIAQCAGAHPRKIDKVYRLHDNSLGNGKHPKWFPQYKENDLVGYAGGINPDNLAKTIVSIHAPTFWLCCESGVRDSKNQFDVGKARAMCRIAYGESK